MINLLNIVIIGIGVYLVYQHLIKKSGFSFYGRKLTKNSMYVHEYNKNLAKRKEWLKKSTAKTTVFFNNIYIFKLSKDERERLEYITLRMDKSPFGVRATFRFYYCIKCLLVSAYIIGVCIASLFNFQYIILLLFYKVVDILFYQFLMSEIKLLNEEIELELADFYSVFYYPLQHKSNKGIRLDDLAKNYEPRAGRQMQILIKSFVADCAESETYALQNLKKNYNIPNIHRIASLLSLVISGHGSAVQAMHNFYMELDVAEDDYLDKQLEKRKVTALKVQAVAWFMLVEVGVIWAITSLANS